MQEAILCAVAVSAANYSIDHPNTFVLPESLQASAERGKRVMVPFGRGNKHTEGLLLEIFSGEKDKKVKPVLSVLDDAPVLDQNGIRLALWMHSRFFCTVYDAMKAMIPSGLYFSLKDCYRLVNDALLTEDDGETITGEQRVLSLLKMHEGELSVSELREAFAPSSPARYLKKLSEQKMIELETYISRTSGDKTEQIAALAVAPEEAFQLIKQKKQPAQWRVVEHLCKYSPSSVKDIHYFCGTTQSVVKALEKKGIVRLERRELYRRPEYITLSQLPPPKLNSEQQVCFNGLEKLMNAQEAQCALLYGVTGSGKTQVYIRLIHSALKQGKSSLVLVPEISLTPQLMELFSAQFGDEIAVLHSALSAGERYDEWKRIRQGDARVVVGTRSAVFAPLAELGLIILDEEQESSYKSENAPRYHTRDVAKFRAAQHNALLLLGSATPSVESMYHANNGTYHLFRMEKRYNQKALPEVFIADMKSQLRLGRDTSLSGILKEEIRKNLDAGEQTILFLNRRGTSRMAVCTECGESPGCPRCSVNLTFHKANGRLMCHHCGHSELVPSVCPTCGGELVFTGAGTQRVEEELRQEFAGIEILRMDADTVSASQPHEQILRKFCQNKIPILLGTQMVAKGLDFEGVTLVGVINADQSLHSEDFRAGERTFSLLTQVVGRSGRGERSGRAIVQTYVPKNDVVLSAAKQDYDTFYEGELELRRRLELPPFRDVYQFTVSGSGESQVLQACMRLRDGASAWSRSDSLADANLQILGPAPAPVLKVNGKYRYRVTVYGNSSPVVRKMTGHLLKAAQTDGNNRGLTISVDFNPMNS